MTAGNMRENGVRSLSIRCRACSREAILNIDHMADDVDLMTLGPQMVCTGCGAVGKASVHPNWKERGASESNTRSTWGMKPPSGK